VRGSESERDRRRKKVETRSANHSSSRGRNLKSGDGEKFKEKKVNKQIAHLTEQIEEGLKVSISPTF